MIPDVKVGPATIWGARAIAVLAAINVISLYWDDLAQRLVEAGVPPSMIAKGALILGVVLSAGRMLQAAAGAFAAAFTGPSTVVATTGAGDIQATPDAPPLGGRLRDGEQPVDPTPTEPTDVPLGQAASG